MHGDYATAEPFLDADHELRAQKIGPRYRFFKRVGLSGGWKANQVRTTALCCVGAGGGCGNRLRGAGQGLASLDEAEATAEMKQWVDWTVRMRRADACCGHSNSPILPPRHEHTASSPQ